MQQHKDIPRSLKFNFFVNLLNFIPFILLIFTGLVLQVGYHMHGLPDDYPISGLNRSGWLLMHEITALLSLTGVTIHCISHRTYFRAAAKRLFGKKSGSRIRSSLSLLGIYVSTSITALCSVVFFGPENHARFALVEIHDKLALLLIVVSAVHIVSRSGWMIKTYQRIARAGAAQADMDGAGGI